MASFVRFSVLAAFITTISGYAIGVIPTQTVGYGSPFLQEPTEAPSMELVKKSLGKRALINTCTEWTIPGGFGQPECSYSETCLFTAATDGYFYEGCGQTSIAYDWITECWPYPQIGTPPVSQIYCPASAPSCGFFAFQFDELNTYYNFGCSTVSYSLYVDLISTTDAGASLTLVLAGGGTTSITATAPVTETVTVGGTETSASKPVVIPSGFGQGTAPTQSSSPTPTIGSHNKKKKAPIGAIVGGVVGGIAVIAFLTFFIWFCLRKRRQDAAATQAHEVQAQQQQADAATAAAFHNHHRVSEIGGTMKPVPEQAGAFAPQQQATYGNGNEKLMGQQVTEDPSPTPQSPPPVYAQPPPQSQPAPQVQPAPTSPYSPSNYTELDTQTLQPGSGHTSVLPVSPVGTHNSNATELGGSNLGTYQLPASPPNVQQQLYQPPPNVQEMSGNAANIRPVSPVGTYNSNATELGGSNWGTYQPPASPSNVQQQLYQPPPNVQEMSGNAASIRPVRQTGGFDMSGAPMSEDYGHHELP